MEISNSDEHVGGIPQNPFDQLREAVLLNSLESAEKVLCEMSDDQRTSALNQRTATGRSLLYLAIERDDHCDLVLVLVNAGAKLNDLVSVTEKSEDGTPEPGFLAVAGEDLKNYMKPASSETVLHMACRLGRWETMTKLFDLKSPSQTPDKNVLDSLERTPLMVAAANGRLECARVLILNESNAVLKDINGKTALHLALDFDHDGIASMVSHNGGDVSIRYHYKPLNRVSLINQPLDANDLETLRRTDRYGNIANPEDQRASITLKSLANISNLEPEIIEKAKKKEIELELERAQKWLSMFKKWKPDSKVIPSKVKSRAVKGIPDRVRGQAWNLMTQSTIQLKANPNTFDDLLNVKSKSEVEIDLDVNRAFRNNIQFRERYGSGQINLFNVLKVFSNYDVEVGYTQGMSSIASLLVMYLSEREAFWTMERLMNKEEYGMRDIFLPGLPGINKMLFVFETIVSKSLPNLYKHFKSEGLEFTLYAVKWFVIGFLDTFSFNYTVRIWDLFFSHGYNIAYTIGLSILKYHESFFLKSSFDQILMKLNNLEMPLSEDAFIQYCMKNKISSKTIKSIEKKYVPGSPFGRYTIPQKKSRFSFFIRNNNK